MRRLLRFLPIAVLMVPGGTAAQATGSVSARAAIVPDSLTVGAIVHAAVRVQVPTGVRVEFPDSLAMPADAEGAGPPNISTDSVAGGQAVTAAYPITAWRPGTLQLPPVGVRLITESGVDTLEVTFPEVPIVSVLPVDTAGVEPRPVRDVLGGERLWWPLLLALLVLAALAALAWWLWRRRRREPEDVPVFAPSTPPRETALALLDRVRQLRLIENGEIRRAYILIAEALRGYLEALDPEWGADLTTTELAALLRVEQVDARGALEVLTHADLVKFAKLRVEAAQAKSDLDQARGWVDTFAEPAEASEDTPVLVMEPR